MKKIDIKYSKVPNVCFSLTDKKDDREPKFKEQRQTNGFDDSETWSLDITIARFIVPRLKRYIELAFDHNVETEEYRQDLQDILYSFEQISSKEIYFETDVEQKIDIGLEKFSKLFRGLWW